MLVPKHTECPQCQAIWTWLEIQEQFCFSCSYNENKPVSVVPDSTAQTITKNAMSFIQETIENKQSDASIDVLEKEDKEELFEENKIISFNTNNMLAYTPNELIDLANWMIESANMIKKKYNSFGQKI